MWDYFLDAKTLDNPAELAGKQIEAHADDGGAAVGAGTWAGTGTELADEGLLFGQRQILARPDREWHVA